MSLLDDVSIVVTPNGYKAGELYAVIPSDGAADMDVTRATDATRVDENGLVNYAEVIGGEEVTDGNFPTPNTAWDLFNGATISGGKANIVGDGTIVGYVEQTTDNFTSGKTYKVTFDAVITSGGGLNVKYGLGYSQNIGTVLTTGSYTFYYTAAINSPILFARKQGGVAYDSSVTNVSIKENARDNVPRIDYTGGGCPHILAEPQRTNDIKYSEDFSNAYWTKSNATIVSNATISPDGTLNADKLVESSTVNSHILDTGNIGGISGTYTYSCFAKKGENNFVVLWWVYASTSKTWFDLENGVVGSQTGTATDNAKIEDYGNGWYKCSVTRSETSTANYLVIATAEQDNVYTYQGDGTSGNYIYGASLEQGSYATSYIPTSGGTVTRNQDIFTRDGIGSLINSTEGVLFVEMAALADDLTGRYVTISDGGTNNMIRVYYNTNSNGLTASYYVGNTAQANFAISLSDVTTFNKIAFKWKINDFALWVNGTEVATDTSGAVNDADTFNEIDFRLGGGNNFFGKVKQLQVYDTALTDDQIRQITQ